ncbi:MAG: DegV family protein [Firmicutes bacterium]|nr:DegV family protein [Bacillota bacterium]
MSNYVIITDSTSDISQKLADELNVSVLPLYFEMDGLVYRNFADEREMTASEFYDNIRKGKTSKTSQINVSDFCEYFSEYLDKGLDILYFAFSSGLSGTYNASCIAIDELKGKYPDRKIISIDTLCASMGEGLLLYYAAQKKKSGMEMEELARWVEDNKLNVCHWFTVDDLNYLKRGGRISAATAIVGTALQIKPLMHVDNEGHLINVSKVRGRKASLNAMVDKMSETYYEEYDTVMISQGDCLDDAEYVASLIKKRFKSVKDVIIGNVGPVVGSHTGPGVVALFFIGKNR